MDDLGLIPPYTDDKTINEVHQGITRNMEIDLENTRVTAICGKLAAVLDAVSFIT